MVHIAGDMPEVGMEATQRGIEGHGLPGFAAATAQEWTNTTAAMP